MMSVVILRFWASSKQSCMSHNLNSKDQPVCSMKTAHLQSPTQCQICICGESNSRQWVKRFLVKECISIFIVLPNFKDIESFPAKNSNLKSHRSSKSGPNGIKLFTSVIYERAIELECLHLTGLCSLV